VRKPWKLLSVEMERRKSMVSDPYSRFLEMLRRSAFSPTSLTRAYLSVPAVRFQNWY